MAVGTFASSSQPGQCAVTSALGWTLTGTEEE